MSDLPIDIDTTYADSGTDASVQAHQQHHDALHGFHNLRKSDSAVNTVAASGASEALDVRVGVHNVTMDQACTFTFTNVPASGTLVVFVLILRGAFTPTLPASVDWGDAAAPTYTAPSMYTFTTIDGGTNWFGAQVGKAFG